MKKNKLNNRKEGTMLTLQHVTINTKNLERSMEFYEEVFGFTRAERPNFDFDGAWYWIEEGKTALHLQINPNTTIQMFPSLLLTILHWMPAIRLPTQPMSRL